MVAKRRIPAWLALLVLAPGLLLTFIGGLWAYMSFTAWPLHPNPQDVPSVTDQVPSPQWGDAVERARQIVRAALIERNLPGLSVAVGAGGEIVWAEGFGWADLENRVEVSPDTRQILESGVNPMLQTGGADSLVVDLTTDDVPDDDRGSRRQRGRQQPIELEGLAEVLGLALGSPEFQRR